MWTDNGELDDAPKMDTFVLCSSFVIEWNTAKRVSLGWRTTLSSWCGKVHCQATKWFVGSRQAKNEESTYHSYRLDPTLLGTLMKMPRDILEDH